MPILCFRCAVIGLRKFGSQSYKLPCSWKLFKKFKTLIVRKVAPSTMRWWPSGHNDFSLILSLHRKS